MHLLTWNPRRWTWKSFSEDLAALHRDGTVTLRWSCGSTRRIQPGERVYLMRLGADPKGLIGSGYVKKGPTERPHWNAARANSGDKALFVEVEFDQLHELPVIALGDLERPPFSEMKWTPQASGIRIPPVIGDVMERLWAQRSGIGAVRGPDEVAGEDELVEGAARRTMVNAYERNGEARRRCLAHYGTRCFACGISFEETYGEFARDYMHVHHVVALSSVKKSYVINPIADLRPLCPNCHAAVHLTDPPMSPEDLRAVFHSRAGA